MKFSDYLKSKRKFLIIWFVIHGFALFVNFFRLEGAISKEYHQEQVDPNWAFVTDKHIYLFADKSWHINSTMESYSSFWPFSIRYESNRESHVYFSGVFYNYDISEFIAYSILIFLLFYLLWENNSKKKLN